MTAFVIDTVAAEMTQLGDGEGERVTEGIAKTTEPKFIIFGRKKKNLTKRVLKRWTESTPCAITCSGFLP